MLEQTSTSIWKNSCSIRPSVWWSSRIFINLTDVDLQFVKENIWCNFAKINCLVPGLILYPTIPHKVSPSLWRILTITCSSTINSHFHFLLQCIFRYFFSQNISLVMFSVHRNTYYSTILENSQILNSFNSCILNPNTKCNLSIQKVKDPVLSKWLYWCEIECISLFLIINCLPIYFFKGRQ